MENSLPTPRVSPRIFLKLFMRIPQSQKRMNVPNEVQLKFFLCFIPFFIVSHAIDETKALNRSHNTLLPYYFKVILITNFF